MADKAGGQTDHEKAVAGLTRPPASDAPAATSTGDPDLDAVAQGLERAILETGDRMLPFFRFTHLPAGSMRETSAAVAELVTKLAKKLPQNAERTVMFRKFLEGKDAAVRTLLQ